MLNRIRLFCISTGLLLLSGCDEQQTPQQTHHFLSQCLNGQLSEISAALDQGIKINSVSPQGISCLMIAAQARREDVVKLLLDRKANPHQKTTSGVTALMLGIGVDNQPELLKMLIAAKSDVNLQCPDGSTPLMIALGSHNAILEDRKTIESLRTKPLSDESEMLVSDGNYSLYPKPDINAVKVLLDANAKVDIKDHEGSTALDYAITREYDTNIMTLLMNAGADVNAPTGYGTTPLIHSFYNQNIDYTRLLISHGANVNSTHKGGEPPLFVAARDATPDTIELLIHHGAEINYQTPRGKTPLMSAVEAKKPENVEALIRLGADINLKDDLGVSALGRSQGSLRDRLIKQGAVIRGQEVKMAETDIQECTDKLFDGFFTKYVSERVVGSVVDSIKINTFVKQVESCANFDDVVLVNYLKTFAPKISPADGSPSMKSNYYGVAVECQIIESRAKCAEAVAP
ncbi:ankyrin repeat domain-containing protein [Budviciaceae bacterium BWR-B9]|uniref:Ankyrin repeat domain-containing protein n=1 Tax=Limnobaculum allomyrinae TaxID=2791986 RepID=A0ABS1IP10_9GAMM|nr:MULTISPECIES: ankyrin repeat domain-containing protein [Limnobaculum]MBK5143497.1 ankyrin repeat domain-containing protein [Limnobaculum allomyrinae]MBV7691385.1 ankyrin repeat domain-containing protein [Limnobaculum sp. M2-1]